MVKMRLHPAIWKLPATQPSRWVPVEVYPERWAGAGPTLLELILTNLLMEEDGDQKGSRLVQPLSLVVEDAEHPCDISTNVCASSLRQTTIHE
jgi:hypothetical protein